MSDKPQKPNWFAQQASGQSRDMQHRQAGVQFEHERLKFMLNKFGLPRTAKTLRDMARERYGASHSHLRFDMFNERFPSFPLVLRAHRLTRLALPYTAKSDGDVTKTTRDDYTVSRDNYSTEPSRFKRFDWVPFVIAFREFEQEVGRAAGFRSIGLIFPRKGFANGMIIHNDESEETWNEGLCWVYKHTDKQTGKQHRLYVQPFQQWVQGMCAAGHSWKW